LLIWVAAMPCREERGHIKKGIAISLTSSLLMFSILAQFISRPALYAPVGIDGTPLYAGLLFFGSLYAPISLLIGIASNIMSPRPFGWGVGMGAARERRVNLTVSTAPVHMFRPLNL
jgi:hypothetical protein